MNGILGWNLFSIKSPKNSGYIMAILILNFSMLPLCSIEKRITIGAIQDDNGSRLKSGVAFSDFLLHKFINLFKSSNPIPNANFDSLFQDCTSEHENAKLYPTLIVRNILKVLKSMNPIKALNPDRMSAHLWPIVGSFVFKLSKISFAIFPYPNTLRELLLF